MNKEEILQSMEGRLPKRQIDELAQLLQPSIRIRTRRVDLRNLPLGASRMGGVPDVPASFTWPQCDGKPLAFLAQIELKDLRGLLDEARLPETGWLLFFYDGSMQAWGFDPADRGNWRVLYSRADASALHRAEHPTLPNEFVSHPCTLSFEAEETVPDMSVLCEDGVYERDSPKCDAFTDWCYAVCDSGNNACHRMFGHADIVQWDMRLECQLVTNGIYCGTARGYEDPRAKLLAPGRVDWELLLQIDTDEDGPGWMWGDCGRVYYCIRQQDLAQSNFDNVWLIFQCY